MTVGKVTYNRDSTLEHPPSLAFPLLFSFKPGNFFKQKLQSPSMTAIGQMDLQSMRRESRKRSLQRKGCRKKSLLCLRDISLSSFSFTKIVTLTSFYSVTNRTDVDVEISDDKKEWLHLPATSKMAFWPKRAKDCEFFVKKGNNVSFTLSYKESNSSLIVIGEELFNVLVDVGDSAINIQLSDYDVGSCPVKIYNYTNIPIEYGQKDVESKKV